MVKKARQQVQNCTLNLQKAQNATINQMIKPNIYQCSTAHYH